MADRIGKPITQRQVDVTMELYSGVTSGVGQLIILGELDPSKNNVPAEFQGMYNVRFVGNIVIDIDIPNTEPIRFFNVPRLTVKEDIRPNLLLPQSDDDAETIAYNNLSAEDELYWFERQIAVVEKMTGEKPRGWRAPLYNFSKHSLDFLVDHGLKYDTSLMGDDIPYVLKSSKGSVIELPTQWFYQQRIKALYLQGRQL